MRPAASKASSRFRLRTRPTLAVTVKARHGALSDPRLASNRIGDSSHLGHLLLVGTQLFQRRAQVIDHHVDVKVAQAALDEMRVCLPHVLTGVVVRAAQHHGQKGLLLRPLPVHVYIVEVAGYPVVHQHPSVKDIHGFFDGGCAAEIVINV